jgi:dihydropteroate synthase
MGVLNVTPDSFSDGGLHVRPDAALRAAEAMIEAGVDVIDVGGESTRPGAEPVDAEEECRRVLPVIEAIATRLRARVSIDTMKAEVARRAIDAGASMINDVSAASDADMAPLAARMSVPLALMHMRGRPRTMQSDTRYDDLLGEVSGFLRLRAEKVVEAGVSNDKIVVDPGIGFGKALEGNLSILRQLPELRGLGLPILIGASRKTFIGAALDLPVSERQEGSLAVAAVAAWNGAHMIRAHDVAETTRVVRMVDAIRNS